MTVQHNDERALPETGCPAGHRVVVGDREGVTLSRVHPRDRFASIRFDDGVDEHNIARDTVTLLPTTRAEIVAHSRKVLAERYAADPASVDRFAGRMRLLSAAGKRERQRVAQRVLGEPAPGPELIRPAGMSKQEWKAERARRIAQHKAVPPSLADKWKGKQGTPETLEKARINDGSLARLEQNGAITSEQKLSADAIANVYRSLEADVTVASASLEARVDNGQSRANAVAESIRRVRLHHAYTIWREDLPHPKRMILDMIVDDAIGYTVAARRYGCHNRKAKRMLLDALDAWPDCVRRAYRTVKNEAYSPA